MGFLADVRRMNVAVTRARRSLWIVGHSRTLEGCPPWKALLEHCKGQGVVHEAARPYAQLVSASGGGGDHERRRRRE